MNGSGSLQEIVSTEKVMIGLKARGVPASFDGALRNLLDGTLEENRGLIWAILDDFWGDHHPHREEFFQAEIVRLQKKYKKR